MSYKDSNGDYDRMSQFLSLLKVVSLHGKVINTIESSRMMIDEITQDNIFIQFKNISGKLVLYNVDIVQLVLK